MGQYLIIHPQNPQLRLLQQAVQIIKKGGVVIFPTDSTYAIGCTLENKNALTRIRQIRHLDEGHHFTLICRDLSELSTYAVLEDAAYRLIRSYTPGPYTFILKATEEVPKRLLHPKRKTIGIRVPDNRILQMLLEELNAPLMSVSLLLPFENKPISNLEMINEGIGKRVDLVINGGPCIGEQTTIVDLSEMPPMILRKGQGSHDFFQKFFH